MKIVFLDRDGVINRFPGNGNYVTKVKDFHFIPGSLEAIRLLTEHGYTIFVISNQAGVGKGIFTKNKLNRITNKLLQGVKKSGGKIRRVYYSLQPSIAGCQYRKPNIGSIEKAMKLLKKPLSAARNGFFVGDTETDTMAGHNAGCTTIHVLSGREDRLYIRRKWSVRPDHIRKNLFEAVQLILKIDGEKSQTSKIAAKKKRVSAKRKTK